VSRVAEHQVLLQRRTWSLSCRGTCVNCTLQVEGVRPTCAIPLLGRKRPLQLCQVHTLMIAVGWVLPVGNLPPGRFSRLGHWWSRSTPGTHLSTCTTLRLYWFEASRPCRPVPACAAPSGYTHPGPVGAHDPQCAIPRLLLTRPPDALQFLRGMPHTVVQ
jgi:hypothetical protein